MCVHYSCSRPDLSTLRHATPTFCHRPWPSAAKAQLQADRQRWEAERAAATAKQEGRGQELQQLKEQLAVQEASLKEREKLLKRDTKAIEVRRRGGCCLTEHCVALGRATQRHVARSCTSAVAWGLSSLQAACCCWFVGGVQRRGAWNLPQRQHAVACVGRAPAAAMVTWNIC